MYRRPGWVANATNVRRTGLESPPVHHTTCLLVQGRDSNTRYGGFDFHTSCDVGGIPPGDRIGSYGLTTGVASTPTKLTSRIVPESGYE